MNVALGLLAIALIVTWNAFFVAAEYAFVTVRRTRLQELLAAAPDALRFSEHMEGSAGEALFRYACAMNLEGIVSKKVTAPYLSGRRIGHPPSRLRLDRATA